MSNKPNPVAETAALLMLRSVNSSICADDAEPRITWTTYTIADLASRLHRIAPACQRLSEAECNGEWRSGQRDAMYRAMRRLPKEAQNQYVSEWQGAFESSCEKYNKRLSKRMEALASELKPLGIKLRWGGDPRGAAITLEYDNGREYHI